MGASTNMKFKVLFCFAKYKSYNKNTVFGTKYVSKQNIDVTDSNYCSYCSSWVQRAIIYNGEQVEKWIDNCREFEKALDRSEVFRSVL